MYNFVSMRPVARALGCQEQYLAIVQALAASDDADVRAWAERELSIRR
jgi:hypothetical protein